MINDGGALSTMCGRDEELRPSVIACWKSLRLAHVAKLETHAVDSEKWTLGALTKIANNAW